MQEGTTPQRCLIAKQVKWIPYIYLSPFIILFSIFGLYPMLFSAWISLHSWVLGSSLDQMKWVGLHNFKYVLTDEWFYHALYNTVWLSLIAGIPQHAIALPLATRLFQMTPQKRHILLCFYFLPFITSSVAISLVFNSIFSRDFGLLNQLLAMLHDWKFIGFKPLNWLFPASAIDWQDSSHIRWVIAFVVFWRYVGWNTLLYLSAMKTIPKELFDAAELDGAGFWQQLRHVILPTLKPMILLALTLSLIGNFQLFEEPFILTSGTGGSGQAGQTLAMYLYTTAFAEGDFTAASATAWLLFIILFSLCNLTRRISIKNDL
ncbi:carbohydrate ABC transporter permease [Tolumonas lignilytica]|uniref:carbohydrate ABC transporter permease n=1 Tax=Tolumonas lignilytica TaxID=1283284 RepID=UPI0004667618|nr:sugar ABC transporter permease [Tolumonas lignilytica]